MPYLSCSFVGASVSSVAGSMVAAIAVYYEGRQFLFAIGCYLIFQVISLPFLYAGAVVLGRPFIRSVDLRYPHSLLAILCAAGLLVGVIVSLIIRTYYAASFGRLNLSMRSVSECLVLVSIFCSYFGVAGLVAGWDLKKYKIEQVAASDR